MKRSPRPSLKNRATLLAATALLALGFVSTANAWNMTLTVNGLDQAALQNLSIYGGNAAGAYIGGAICPGVRLAADTLSSGAALLPKVSIEAPKNAIRGDTVGAMQSGIVFGAAAMVDGMIDRFEEELGHGVAAVGTGGLARDVIPHCKRKIQLDNNLLLTGLRILYEKNRKK